MSNTCLAVFASALTLAAAAPTFAANRAIEDVRTMRQGGVSTVDIVLACPASYLDHVPAAGPELRVRVELGGECAEALGYGIRAELHEPPRSTVAAIRQVRYDTRDGREGALVVTVSPAQRFTVSQGRGRNIIHIELRSLEQPALPDTRPTSVPDRRPTSVPVPRPTSAPVPAAEPEPTPKPPPVDREPLRLVERPVERQERFALQLAAGAGAGERLGSLGAEHAAGRSVYVNEHGGDDARWQELRLGFFSSEQEAREFAARLPEPFTASLVVVADGAEQERALAAAARAEPAGAAAPRAVPPVGDFQGSPLTPERLAALTAQANDAMLGGDHDTAIRLYSRLLQDHKFAERRLARERIGIARERKGQLAQARAEYQAYLGEFPLGADADAERVQQRLAGLAAGAAPVVAAPVAMRSEAPRWDLSGGMAHYVRYGELERPGTMAALAEQSSLLSNVNLVVRRDGERFDLLHRLDAAYHYNLLDATVTSAPSDQLLVSNAYFDVTDEKHDWQARVGRQSQYGSGIVGRFDGAHVRYQWQPEIALNLALGLPVDYPRRAVDTRRQFVGFSADLDRLVKQWDFSFFGIAQTVDGVADREAIGAEARYRSERWHVVGAIDADLSYSVVNSALVNATWRVTGKLTLNGRFNFGAAPYLTTRNALIGQPEVTVEGLLDTYTEGQLRSIARDRTADAAQGTIGLSRPVLDRFQLHADVGWYDFDGSVSSAGIAAVPSVQQTFLLLTFVGSSLFKDGDSAVFSLRRTEARAATNDVLTFDFRLPTRGRLRLNPRLQLASRRYADGSSEQWTAAPQLKLALRWPRRHQFELELGARQSTREYAAFGALAPPPDDELTETFIHAGYWWELGR
jgi:hypothetical protein